ncbi:hypothetical protein FACS189419_10170 [Planctomycetales bacterium]|nr:hypothetical protein FACS189419_10170 [Planctomycetales bacterium]
MSADELQAQFDALEIPPNIDPRLLEIYLQREQDEIERKRKRYISPPPKYGRKLSQMFAAYIGIGVMCLSIVLGLVQGKEPADILHTTCIVFLLYTIAGFFTGVIAEHCVTDSVETLLREIVARSKGAALDRNNAAPQDTESIAEE